MGGSNAEKPTPRRRSRCPEEFRRDAAALVVDGKRTVADVARKLRVVGQTLANWTRQECINRGEREGSTTEDREAMERDQLKRSVVFWVMELDQLSMVLTDLEPFLGSPPIHCLVRGDRSGGEE